MPIYTFQMRNSMLPLGISRLLSIDSRFQTRNIRNYWPSSRAPDRKLLRSVKGAHRRASGTLMNYLSLPIGEQVPEIVNAVVEIPGRQANKYEYDKSLHLFRLDRPLYGSVHYPGDYGFIPSTLAND